MKRWQVGKLSIRLSRQQVTVCLGWVALIVLAMVLSTYAVAGIAWLMVKADWLSQINASVVNLVSQGFVHIVTVVVVCLVAWRVKRPLSIKQAGVQRLIEWRDIGLAAIGAIAYLVLTVILSYIAQSIIPGFDPSQRQDIGAPDKLFSLDLALAFAILVIVVPLCEELIFRGILYGRLRAAKISAVLCTVFVSILFGVAHGQWNVGIDTFALSLVLCALREYTGSIWAGFLLHLTKNSIAFYALYIATTLW